jgi:hypothetical protein
MVLSDVERDLRRSFRPARRVIVLRNLLQAELLVIARTDPFGRIDRATLERGIDFRGADLQLLALNGPTVPV